MNTTRYNRFCRFYFQRPSPCSPLFSSQTSSAQPQALVPHMEHATPAQSALPRGAALMGTVLLGLECAVSLNSILINDIKNILFRCDHHLYLQHHHLHQHNLHQKSKLPQFLHPQLHWFLRLHHI